MRFQEISDKVRWVVSYFSALLGFGGGAGLCNWLQRGRSAFVAAKRTDQSPFWVLRKGKRDSRCREQLSASGALPGRDIPFTVSYVAEGAIHEGTRSTITSIRSREGKRSYN
jgi:hypothetical protein